MISAFISAFLALFIIVDPLGTAAVFATLISRFTHQQAKKIAVKATIIAICVLLAFALGGQTLLNYTGISPAAFRVAGGIYCSFTAFRMIMGSHDSETLESEETNYKDRSNIAIFPLAIPLLAGPGCMTAALLNMGKAVEFADKAMVLTAIVAVEIVALICMLCAGKLVRVLGASGSSLLARLMGILLAAMAVQFIADGVHGLFTL